MAYIEPADSCQWWKIATECSEKPTGRNTSLREGHRGLLGASLMDFLMAWLAHWQPWQMIKVKNTSRQGYLGWCPPAWKPKLLHLHSHPRQAQCGCRTHCGRLFHMLPQSTDQQMWNKCYLKLYTACLFIRFENCYWVTLLLLLLLLLLSTAFGGINIIV